MAKSKTAPDADLNKMTETLAEMQQAGLKSMGLMGADWMERISDLSAEMFSFAAERFQQDVALQHRMLHCKSPAELQEIQSEFLQTAINRYTEETGRMMELGQKLFSPKSDT